MEAGEATSVEVPISSAKPETDFFVFRSTLYGYNNDLEVCLLPALVQQRVEVICAKYSLYTAGSAYVFNPSVKHMLSLAHTNAEGFVTPAQTKIHARRVLPYLRLQVQQACRV